MRSSWVKGLDKEEERGVRSNFLEALVLRKRLKQILEDKQSDSHRVGRSKSLYENPNWAYLQADASGYERALEEIIDLIS